MEGLAVVANALLPVEDGAGGRLLHTDGQEDVQGQQEDEGNQGEHDVEAALEETLPRGQVFGRDVDERLIHHGAGLDGAEKHVLLLRCDAEGEVAVVAGQHDEVVDMLALPVVERDNQLLDVVLADDVGELPDGAEVGEMFAEQVLGILIHLDVPDQEVARGGQLLLQGVVNLQRLRVAAHDDGVETDQPPVYAAVDAGGDADAGDVGEEELQREVAKHIFNVVAGRGHNVVEDEEEEEDKDPKNRDPEGGLQLIETRFAIYFVVVAEEGVQKYPEGGRQQQSTEEGGVGHHRIADGPEGHRFAHDLTVHI